jgi:Flp pilus assembly protein TadD
MEVGEINFKNGSYRGAEWRFRDALDYKPDNPEATFWMAKSIDKLGRSDEAQNAYRAYLNSSLMGFLQRRRKTRWNGSRRSL